MDLSVRTDLFALDDQSWLGSARGTQSARTVTLKTAAFTAGTHYPNGYFPSGLALAIPTSGANAGFAVPLAARPSEVQTVTITGSPTGGTFTLTLDGATTAAIAYNATAAVLQAALEGLPNIDPGDVVVAGSAGGPYTLTFAGKRAGLDVPQTSATASLTGGTSPGVTTATTSGGGSGVSDGSDVLAGFLFTAVRSPIANTTNVAGAMLDNGRVIASKLPIAVSAAQQATNPRFVFA